MTGLAERYGSWAVVAGASEGLGAAFAAALAERGLHLVLLARRELLLAELAGRLREAHAVQVRCLRWDLADPGFAPALAEATADLELGVLVYNAAFVPVGRFLDVDGNLLERAVDVNVAAPVRFLRTLLPGMRTRGRGAVVLMSSLAGLQGAPGIATYAASRAFNTILAEGLWHELADDGIDVTVCCAGAMRTPGYLRATDRQAPGTLAPAVVARRTLDALGRGPRVVPGLVNRLAAQVIQRLLPRRAAVRLMAANTRFLS